MGAPPSIPGHRRAGGLFRGTVAGLAALATAVVGLTAPAAAAEADGPTVYLAGDSTVQTYDPYWEPQAGWGQMIDRFFDEEVRFDNHAIGGRSSRSFVEQGRLDVILDQIEEGDYLFVQFGHNDATVSVPERYTPPEDFKEYLREDYIAGARERGATPVLVTPVSRRAFDANTGEFHVSFPEYVEKMVELAVEEDVPLVDLSASSRAYLNDIGPEEAKSVFLHVPAGLHPNRPTGTVDDTHFQEYGAIRMAELVARGVAELDLPLADRVREIEAPETVPDAPTGLRADTVSNEEVGLVWDAVPGADIYRVRVREADDPDAEFRLAAGSTVPLARVGGLAEGVAHEIRVSAVNARGESEPSATLTVTTAVTDLKFDFGPNGSPVADGFRAVHRGTAYTEERGYGLLTDGTPMIDRDRGAAFGDVERDFVAYFGERYEFAVDVPDGRYSVRAYVGDGLGSARSEFAVEGEPYGSVAAPRNAVITQTFGGILVTDGQLNIEVFGQTAHLNGLEVTRVGPLPGEEEEDGEPSGPFTRNMEYLDRSPVAVLTDGGVYLGWRMLGLDPDDIAFHVYRDRKRITDEPLTGSTNLFDPKGKKKSVYRVEALLPGGGTESTESFGVWEDQYLDVAVDRPADGTTPDGNTFSYHLNDATVADLTGDGRYEIVQLWQPSNARDNSQSGYTGHVLIDAYTLEGERLWRMDLGPNIRAGAHYTSLIAYDLDNSGSAELVLKTADGTVDGTGAVIGDPDADHRNSGGYVLAGPEFLTVFDGATGAALDTVDYVPARGNVCDWGDCYGNRVDRLMAAVAYLDGENPSVVVSRGIYTRSVLAAFDFDGEGLSHRWTFDSDEWGPRYAGQGNHQLSIADVDGDGRDEIVYGAMTVNHNGRPLYSSRLGHGDALHVSDLDPSRPGQEIFSTFESMSDSGGRGAALRDAATGEIIWSMPSTRDVGRGAAGDIDPTHPGAEAWAVTVDGGWNSRAGELRAADGTLIGTDIPAANFMIWWDGDLLREILDHEFDPNGDEPAGRPYIAKWDWEEQEQREILAPEGVFSNNHTKGTPVLQADLFGDWREEVIWRLEDDSALRILTTTDVTGHRLRTLMHDPQYRLAVAWQNESYNQPPHPGFFLGTDMEEPPAPDIRYVGAPPADGDDGAPTCEVRYTVHGAWPAGFNAQVWISNTGDEELRDWELSWTFPDGQHVTQMWSARPEQEGATVTVRPESRLSRIAPGSSVTFGFLGHRGDANGVPESFAIDGAACSVG
ncbi:cellulose binding domain-containing protein [Streptomyces alkaliphilus]|uniref:rhamnogalacturonan lyase family protein n=1 Tax=Streptomyces alkaliphilus TaxID=1472722 RepID=UPI001566B3B6|nr:cellulose binding domain-containing protein [Streptomyces alkaliphilus]